MSDDERQRLLARIHADLDDDLARSVYADHLLELGGHDAWHGELIRLQLDGAAPERVAELLRGHETRALGPIVRLFDVSWIRGFPERLRTRKWKDEHVLHLLASSHLPTIRAVECAFLRAVELPALLAAPEITKRVTDLNVYCITHPLFAALLAAADQFPRLRRLGLAIEPEPPVERLSPDSLGLLFESPLGQQLEHVQNAVLVGEREDWIPELRLAPRTLQQFDLLEVNRFGTAQHLTIFVRDATGVLTQSADPMLSIIAILRADGDAGIESETTSWPVEQLEAVAARLVGEGMQSEAATVLAIAKRRKEDAESQAEGDDDDEDEDEDE